MKKRRVLTFLLLVLVQAVLVFSLLFSLFGCTYDQRLARALAVESEVSPGCAIVGEEGITLNGRFFDYEDEAGRLIGRLDGSDYARTFAEDGVYFLCDYRRGLFPRNRNAALFFMDYRSGACELIRNLGEILPAGKYGNSRPALCPAVDERFFLFALNGRLQLFDLDSRTVVWEERVYDPRLYTEAEIWEYPYRFGPGCYFALDGGTLQLWHVREGRVEKLTFPDLEQSDEIGFFRQIVYAAHYDGGTVYDMACDLETGQPFPVEELRVLIEEENARPRPEGEQLEFRGEILTVERTSENLRLLRPDGQVFLDAESCMAQNPVLARLDEAWDTNFRPLPAEAFVWADKLILAWQSEGSMMTPQSPLYLFEFDPELGPRYLGLAVGQLQKLLFF